MRLSEGPNYVGEIDGSNRHAGGAEILVSDQDRPLFELISGDETIAYLPLDAGVGEPSRHQRLSPVYFCAAHCYR